MLRLVLYTPKSSESRQLQQEVREKLAWNTEEGLDCVPFESPAAAAQDILHSGAELIGWDVTTEDSRRMLENVRRQCRDAFLVVIAAHETSPLLFLTPLLGPDSLLLRPLEKSEIKRVASEMSHALHARQSEETADSCFVINRREEQQRIPYASIFYFEARERRLYARLRGEEIGFTGTLDQLQEELPDNFRRVHRGFIVNTDKIEQVLLAENMLVLWEGLSVPLSRSYKKGIKELYHV